MMDEDFGVIPAGMALALLRLLPGDRRVLAEILSGRFGRIVQWDSGIQLERMDGRWRLWMSESLYRDWKNWKATATMLSAGPLQ